MDTAGVVTVPTIVAANHQAASAINVNHPINSIPPHQTIAHPRNILTIAHANTNTSSASNSNGNTPINNSSLINSSLIINSNSSSSSSSSSSASSGYGSTSATPTNSYETHAAATTPVAIAEPIIPIATVAAVSPYYSESLTTQAVEGQHYVQQHQQQHQRQSLHHLNSVQHQQPQAQAHQHQLQQNLQHSQRQQYYTSTYDYQQQQQLLQPLPPPLQPSAPPSLHQQQTVHPQQQQQQQQSQALSHPHPHPQPQPQPHPQSHSLPLTYNMGSGSAAIDCTSVNSSSASASAASYQVGGQQYKHLDSSSISYERTHVARPQAGALAPTLNYTQTMQQQIPNDLPANKHSTQSHAQQQQQFLNATSSTSSAKSRPASSLLGSLSSSANSSSTTTTKPQAAATPFYAQPLAQQSTNTSSFYDNLKHTMPHDYHDNFVNFPNAAAYHQQQKYYAAAKSQLKDASSYASPPALGGKSMFSNTNSYYGAATGQHANSGYDKYMYPTSYPSLAYESPPDPTYRKGNTTGSLNSHSWPWGIDYASGNSRTIPPPTGHIPTATVAPTHASYLTANAPHLARDPYYMAHDKYGMKYDKYAPPYQQTYVSPPGARHHLWPGTHAALSERLPPPPHTLHTTPYYPPNAPPSSLNARQTCCTQPYQTQSCYYPPTRLPPHGQAAAMGQTSAYIGNSGQPTSNSHQPHHLSPLSSSCKFGSVIDYGVTNKLKNPNDLYLGAHYESNPVPPPHHAYNYGTTSNVANQLYNTNQLHHGAQPAGPLITHESLVSTPNFTNDLSLNTNTYNSYNHHHDPNHMNPQSLGMTSNGPTVPGYAQANSKRALLDYRKPIQTQPTQPAPQQEQSYGQIQNTSATLSHYQSSTDLLNTPETTTFAEYDAQGEVIGYTAAQIPVTVDQSGKSGDDATKNLSLRDFIANWNDDEDECAANEDATFNQSTVINDVLSAGTVAEPILASDHVPDSVPVPVPVPVEVQETVPAPVVAPVVAPMPMEVLQSSVKPVQAAVEPEEKSKSPSHVNKNTETISESTSTPVEYVNLPDIVIDIEKSNVPTTITTPPTIGSDAASLVLDQFDVEKELDQLQMKKNETDSIIANPRYDINSIKDGKQDVSPKSKSYKEPVKVPSMELDHKNMVQKKPVPATRPQHTTCEHTNTATPTEQSLRDMEGYDSGCSRNSNESSLFEKEYETFINKITTTVPKSKSECEIEDKVKEFSKFYKRKRKLKEEGVKPVESADEDSKRLKSSEVEKSKKSNFPQVYTKKSRNRHLSVALWIKNHPKRKWKPLSIYYKLIHSLRRYRRYRSKKAREVIAELKEKHLPLIKRRSIKNYPIAENPDVMPLFNPKSLKSLVLTVINSEHFRDRLLNVSMEVYVEAEQKHICTDPMCETCDVIRSLMEPEGFNSIIGEQSIAFGSANIDISNGTELIYLGSQDENDMKQTESFGSQEFAALKPEDVILVIESESTKIEQMDTTPLDYRSEQTSAEPEIIDGSESTFAQTTLILSPNTESHCKDDCMAVENLSKPGNKVQVTSCIRIAPLNAIDLNAIHDDVQCRGDADIMVPPEVNPQLAPSVIKATATELTNIINDDPVSLKAVEDNSRLDFSEPSCLPDTKTTISSDIISQISSVIQKVPVTSAEDEPLPETQELNKTTNTSTNTLDADTGEKSATISTAILADSGTSRKESIDNIETTENIVEIENDSDSESESESESSECDSNCSCSSCTSSDSSDEDEKEVAQSKPSSVHEVKGSLNDDTRTRRESFKRKTSNEDSENYPAHLKKSKSEFEYSLVDKKATDTGTSEKVISHDQLPDARPDAMETKETAEEYKAVSSQSRSPAVHSFNANIVEITAESESETDSSSSEDNSDDETDLSHSENETDLKSSTRIDDCVTEAHAKNEIQKLERDVKESLAENELEKVDSKIRERHSDSEAHKLEGDTIEKYCERETCKLEGDIRESHFESKLQKLDYGGSCQSDDHLSTVKEETDSTEQIQNKSENLTSNVSLSENVIHFKSNHIHADAQSATIPTNVTSDTNLNYAKLDDKKHDMGEEQVATQPQEKQQQQQLFEQAKDHQSNSPKELLMPHHPSNSPNELLMPPNFQSINFKNVSSDKPTPTVTDSQSPPSNMLETHNIEPIDYSQSKEQKNSKAVDAQKREAINAFEESSLSNNSQNNVLHSAPARPRIILSIKRTPEIMDTTKDTTSSSEKDAEKYHYTTKLKSVDFTTDLHGESKSSFRSEGFESENEEDAACVEIYNEDVINNFASKRSSKQFEGTFTKENSLSSRDFNAFNLSEIDEKMGDLFPHTSFGRVSRTFDIPDESLLSDKSDMCINIEEKELTRSFEGLQSCKESPSQKSSSQSDMEVVNRGLEKEHNADTIVDTAANSENSAHAEKETNDFITESTESPPKNFDEEYGNPWTPTEVNDILKFPTPVRNFPEDSTSREAYLSISANSPLTLRKDEKLSELNSRGSDTFEDIHFQHFLPKDQTIKSQPKEGLSKTFPAAFGGNDAFIRDSSTSSTSSSEELILNTTSSVEVRNDTETPQGSMGNRVSVISFSHSNTETSDVTSQKEGLSRMICNTTYIDSMSSSLEHSVAEESSITNTSDGAKHKQDHEAEKDAYDLKQFNFHSIFGNMEKLGAAEGELSTELQENSNLPDNSIKGKQVSEVLLEPTLFTKESYLDAKLEENRSLDENASLAMNNKTDIPKQTLEPTGVIVSLESPGPLNSQFLQHENKMKPQYRESIDTKEYKLMEADAIQKTLSPDYFSHQEVSILHPIKSNTLICDLVDAFVESASTLMEEKYEQVAETRALKECLQSPDSIESNGNEIHDDDANNKQAAESTEIRDEPLPNKVALNKILVPEAPVTNQYLPPSTQKEQTPAAEDEAEYPLDCKDASISSCLKKAEEFLTDSQRSPTPVKTPTINQDPVESPENLHPHCDIIQLSETFSRPLEINLTAEEKVIDTEDTSIDIKSESIKASSASTPNEDREIAETQKSFKHDTVEDNQVGSLDDSSEDNVGQQCLQSPPINLEQPHVSHINSPQEYLEEVDLPKLSVTSNPKCYVNTTKVQKNLQDDLNDVQLEKPKVSVEPTNLKVVVEKLPQEQTENLNIPIKTSCTFEPTSEDVMEIKEDLEHSKMLQSSSQTLSLENIEESIVDKNAAEKCKSDAEEEPEQLPKCSENTSGYNDENETQQDQVDENKIKISEEQHLPTLSLREADSQNDIDNKSDNDFVSEEQEIALNSEKNVKEVNKEPNKEEEAIVEEKSINNSNFYEINKSTDNATKTIVSIQETRSECILNPDDKSNTGVKHEDCLISEDPANVNKLSNRINEDNPSSSETGHNFPDSEDCLKPTETVCMNTDDMLPTSKADDVIVEQPIYPRFGRFKNYLSKKLESHNESKIMEKCESSSNSQASSPKAVSPSCNDPPLNSERLGEEIFPDSHPKSCENMTSDCLQANLETIEECPKTRDEQVCPGQDDKSSGSINSLSNQMTNKDSLSSNLLGLLDDELASFGDVNSLPNVLAESAKESPDSSPLDNASKGHSEESLNSSSVVIPEVLTSASEQLANSSSLDKLSVPDDGSSHFLGFRNQASFEDESDDFHGFEDQHEEDRIRREIESLNEDSAANDAFPCVNTLNKKTPSDSGSMSSELNELEALEKALSQHRLISESDGPSEAEENAAASKNLVSVANESISTNDIEHIKQMLESDEEHNDNEKETQITTTKEVMNLDLNLLHTKSKIPKLSDLCRAALNSSLIVSKMTSVESSPRGFSPNNDLCEKNSITTDTTTSSHSRTHSPTSSSTTTPSNTMNALVMERELSVEEALADMYRQAGIMLSDPEDTDNEKSLTNEEAQDVLLINLQEILNSDNDNGFVLQCDMNVNVQENVNENHLHVKSDNAHLIHSPSGHENANNTTERVGTVQLIGFLNTNLETPEIHIISSDSESEVIILSDCDTDVEFSFSPQPLTQTQPQLPPPPIPTVVTKTAYTGIDASREYIPFIDDLKTNDDSQSDIWTIHHEEIVPDNLNKYLKEEFYRYLHEKYAQKKLSKYYHANRILRKYKKRLTNKCWH